MRPTSLDVLDTEAVRSAGKIREKIWKAGVLGFYIQAGHRAGDPPHGRLSVQESLGHSGFFGEGVMSSSAAVDGISEKLRKSDAITANLGDKHSHWNGGPRS